MPGIRLSHRVTRLKPSATLAVGARVAALRKAGVDVVGFGAGEPDFDTPEPVKRAAIAALERGMTKYQPVPGTPEAREAIARKLREENGIECRAEHVVITVGGKSAVHLVMQALLDEGEGHEVVLPTPAWVSYAPIAGLCGGTVIPVPSTAARDFRITPEELDAAITPRTRLVILNSPSNPCGTMYTPEEIAAFAEVLGAHAHVMILSDEIYEKLIFGGVAHRSIGSIAQVAARTITVNGLSKAYAMTGWRLGYLCAPGEDGAVAKAAANLQGQMTSHATSFLYPAVVEAMTHGAAEVERMRRVFAQRAERMHAAIASIPGVRCPRPMGAFYVFPDISCTFGRTTAEGRIIDSSLSFSEALLEEARVAVVPGEEFGPGGETCVRLGFACGEEMIDEGCRRLAAWMKTLR